MSKTTTSFDLQTEAYTEPWTPSSPVRTKTTHDAQVANLTVEWKPEETAASSPDKRAAIRNAFR